MGELCYQLRNKNKRNGLKVVSLRLQYRIWISMSRNTNITAEKWSALLEQTNIFVRKTVRNQHSSVLMLTNCSVLGRILYRFRVVYKLRNAEWSIFRPPPPFCNAFSPTSCVGRNTIVNPFLPEERFIICVRPLADGTENQILTYNILVSSIRTPML